MTNFRASQEAAQNLLRALLAFIFAFVFSGLERAGAASTTDKPVAAVFWGERPGPNQGLARQLAEDMQAAGYVTKMIGPDVLTNSASLLSLKLDLLVLPQARSLPVASMDAVRDYLRGGGRMMALGLPAWDSPTFAFNGKLLSKQDYQRLLDAQVADHAIVDFAREDLSKWNHSAEGANTKTQIEIAADDGRQALHVTIDNLGGWDTLASPSLPDPFLDGRTLTCFRARGTKDTPQMSIEWDERDGSRWIATIDLTTEWKSYCLAPESFRFWESTPGRGGAGDRFDVRHATRLSVGLARSHDDLPGAHHEYWIGNLGTAHSPFGELPAPFAVEAPPIDTLSPGWKFYPIHGAIKLATPEELALVSAARVQPPDEGGNLPEAMHLRPRGVGFNQQRPWRWQPLLEARSPQGDYRGAMATMLVQFEGEFRGGIWACFTPDSPAFYAQKPVRQLLRETARVMRRGLFLQEGGSEFFTVFDRQDFHLGARAVNFSSTDQTNLALRISVKPKTGQSNLFAREWPLALAVGDAQMVQEQWQPTRWPDCGLIVATELVQDGQIIDRLEHKLNVWRPKPRPEFIAERAGGFWLRDKPWKVNGVNYMPSTGIGVSGGDYFEYWLGKGAYDPEAIERGLRRIKAMNLNAVSIFVDYSSMKAQHLLDFLRRCQERGLQVNQSLRPGTPMNFHWEEMKELIEFYHLAENDTVFAYDLAWEPAHQNQQSSYGEDWTHWVTRRYGSVAEAEKVWGLPLPQLNKNVLSVPSMRQLAHDFGTIRVAIASMNGAISALLTATAQIARLAASSGRKARRF